MSIEIPCLNTGALHWPRKTAAGYWWTAQRTVETMAGSQASRWPSTLLDMYLGWCGGRSCDSYLSSSSLFTQITGVTPWPPWGEARTQAWGETGGRSSAALSTLSMLGCLLDWWWTFASLSICSIPVLVWLLSWDPWRRTVKTNRERPRNILVMLNRFSLKWPIFPTACALWQKHADHSVCCDKLILSFCGFHWKTWSGRLCTESQSKNRSQSYHVPWYYWIQPDRTNKNKIKERSNTREKKARFDLIDFHHSKR